MKRTINTAYIESAVHRHLDDILKGNTVEIDGISIRLVQNGHEKIIIAQYSDKIKYVLTVH
ncbi:MAG: hypothetical protein QXI84_08870 [Thermofilaceae archaeon]|uniref:hypothetical protein n=1 Tax=Thermofilum sp. TaxID=1961369 RepID=UPI0031602809